MIAANKVLDLFVNLGLLEVQKDSNCDEVLEVLKAACLSQAPSLVKHLLVSLDCFLLQRVCIPILNPLCEHIILLLALLLLICSCSRLVYLNAKTTLFSFLRSHIHTFLLIHLFRLFLLLYHLDPFFNFVSESDLQVFFIILNIVDLSLGSFFRRADLFQCFRITGSCLVCVVA
jgi:hypothetical protein